MINKKGKKVQCSVKKKLYFNWVIISKVCVYQNLVQSIFVSAKKNISHLCILKINFFEFFNI